MWPYGTYRLGRLLTINSRRISPKRPGRYSFVVVLVFYNVCCDVSCEIHALSGPQFDSAPTRLLRVGWQPMRYSFSMQWISRKELRIGLEFLESLQLNLPRHLAPMSQHLFQNPRFVLTPLVACLWKLWKCILHLCSVFGFGVFNGCSR